MVSAVNVMTTTTEDRVARMPAYSIRVDPSLIELAKLGLMLPAAASVSEVVRAALALAAGEEAPSGVVSRGGWRPRRARVYVDRSTMRVRQA